jgi:hypothetical protein
MPPWTTKEFFEAIAMITNPLSLGYTEYGEYVPFLR